MSKNWTEFMKVIENDIKKLRELEREIRLQELVNQLFATLETN